jgi:hypothetical protein
MFEPSRIEILCGIKEEVHQLVFGHFMSAIPRPHFKGSIAPGHGSGRELVPSSVSQKAIRKTPFPRHRRSQHVSLRLHTTYHQKMCFTDGNRSTFTIIPYQRYNHALQRGLRRCLLQPRSMARRGCRELCFSQLLLGRLSSTHASPRSVSNQEKYCQLN